MKQVVENSGRFSLKIDSMARFFEWIIKKPALCGFLNLI